MSLEAKINQTNKFIDDKYKITFDKIFKIPNR